MADEGDSTPHKEQSKKIMAASKAAAEKMKTNFSGRWGHGNLGHTKGLKFQKETLAKMADVDNKNLFYHFPD